MILNRQSLCSTDPIAGPFFLHRPMLTYTQNYPQSFGGQQSVWKFFPQLCTNRKGFFNKLWTGDKILVLKAAF